MTGSSENVVSINRIVENNLQKQAALISQINRMLAESPVGKNISLLITSGELKANEGEVLVQNVDTESRSIVITVKNIDDLTIDDVIHVSQALPVDTASMVEGFVNDTHMAKCLKRHNSPGTIHVYD